MTDAERITELEAEVARLRASCEEFDVDPEWEPPKPLYWVPQEWETSLGKLVAETLRRRTPSLGESLMRNNALLRRLSANG